MGAFLKIGTDGSPIETPVIDGNEEAVTLVHLRKAGALMDGELAAGEFGVDVTNSEIYISYDGTTVTKLQVLPLGGTEGAMAFWDDSESQWAIIAGPAGDYEIVRSLAGVLGFSNIGTTLAKAMGVTQKGVLLVGAGANTLAKFMGTDGELLVFDSGTSTGLNTTPVPSGGSVVFLGSAIADGSTELTFDGVFSDDYDSYEVHYIDVAPATNNVAFRFRFRDGTPADVGGTYTGTYRSERFDTSGAGPANSMDGISKGLGNASLECLSGVMTIWPRSTKAKRWITHSTKTHENGNYYAETGAGALANTSQMEGVRFEMSSGNIATGKILIYGLKNS